MSNVRPFCSVGGSVSYFALGFRMISILSMYLYTICERAGRRTFLSILMLMCSPKERQFLKSTNIQRTLMNDPIVKLFSTQYSSPSLSLSPSTTVVDKNRIKKYTKRDLFNIFLILFLLNHIL